MRLIDADALKRDLTSVTSSNGDFVKYKYRVAIIG